MLFVSKLVGSGISTFPVTLSGSLTNDRYFELRDSRFSWEGND